MFKMYEPGYQHQSIVFCDE